MPQFEIIGPDVQAIRVTCLPFIHKWHRIKSYGWYIWLPLFQTWTELNIKPQILIVDITRTIKNTNKTIESMWVIQYWPQDIYKACFEVEEHEERLACQAAKVIGDRIENEKELVTGEMLSEIREGVRGFGLWVQDVYKKDYMTVRTWRMYHNWNKNSRVYSDTT